MNPSLVRAPQDADTRSMSSTSPAPERRGASLAVLLSATFMALLDFFIVFVATPSITADLHASSSEVEWVVAAYGLVYALGLISGGRLGDLFGRRRVFRIGLTLFAAASALCGVAPNPSLLIAARVLQALGSALMMPQVLSIIQVEFAPHERGRAMAIMGIVQGMASVAGQLIGGALIELNVFGLQWRSIFLVNVPIAAVALVASERYLRESRAEHARTLDVGGVALSLAALAALTVPLVEGRTAGWPGWTFVSLAASIPLVALFLCYERRLEARGGAPVVGTALLALRPFRLGGTISFLVYTTVVGWNLTLAIVLQEGRHLGPLAAGLTFAPVAVGIMITSLITARATIPTRERMLAAGALTSMVGVAAIAIMSLSLGHPPAPLAMVAPLFVLGCGWGVLIPGLNGIVVSETPLALVGAASGLLQTAQQTGGALGVAVAGTLFFDVVDSSGYGDGLAVVAAYVALGTLVSAGLCVLLTGRLGPLRLGRGASGAPAAADAT
jgi:EmrB/QacA subfamily drug resistance transporter